MQIRHVVIKVDDQDNALAFYTSILGFVKRHDIPNSIRWLTVSAPEGAEGVELVLEPNEFPPARASQQALYNGGFPATILTTTDIAVECKRLKGLGVEFRGEPKRMGPVTFVFFDDTCGNWIVLNQRMD